MGLLLDILKWGLAVSWTMVFLAVCWLAWITRNKKVDHE